MTSTPQGEAVPTVAGNYTSLCISCNRWMEEADKLCRLCADCKARATPQGEVTRGNEFAVELRCLAADIPRTTGIILQRAAKELDRLQSLLTEREKEIERLREFEWMYKELQK